MGRSSLGDPVTNFRPSTLITNLQEGMSYVFSGIRAQDRHLDAMDLLRKGSQEKPVKEAE